MYRFSLALIECGGGGDLGEKKRIIPTNAGCKEVAYIFTFIAQNEASSLKV
jgi:hypothetical protein